MRRCMLDRPAIAGVPEESQCDITKVQFCLSRDRDRCISVRPGRAARLSAGTHGCAVMPSMRGAAYMKDQPRLALVVSPSFARSGLSRILETPDTSSAFATRLSGMRLDFRHFWTAWYDTPIRSAKTPRPPLRLIATSTSDAMDCNLQPIVAVRQQPPLAFVLSKLQPMIALTKNEARKRFGQQLNTVCNALGAPVRGRPKWLQKQIRNAVSYEQCRKWLAGIDIPDEANTAILVDSLGTSTQYLKDRVGTPLKSSRENSEADELLRIWNNITDEGRAQFLRSAHTIELAYNLINQRKRASKG